MEVAFGHRQSAFGKEKIGRPAPAFLLAQSRLPIAASQHSCFPNLGSRRQQNFRKSEQRNAFFCRQRSTYADRRNLTGSRKVLSPLASALGQKKYHFLASGSLTSGSRFRSRNPQIPPTPALSPQSQVPRSPKSACSPCNRGYTEG